MSTEVNYMSNVCVMGKKLLLNLSANLQRLFTISYAVLNKLKSLMEIARKQSISSRHKRINSFPLVQILIILVA